MGHGVIPFSLPPCQMNRTGDGHKMGVWAGGEIELTPVWAVWIRRICW